jgi:putative phosphoesterase
MRIGVVSDTHDNTANVRRIVEIFNAAGVERVVHTGDITKARTLAVLAHLDAPLVGVYGNNDREREALERAAGLHGMRLVDPPLSLPWAGTGVAVVHDPEAITPELLARHGVVLHGHTHRRVLERRAGALVFNPGECAGHLRGHNVVGVLDLVTLEVDLHRF